VTPFAAPLVARRSPAWPRLTQCFQGKASEILMHPLRTAFNVGDNHPNQLSVGCALRAAPANRVRQKRSDGIQLSNNAKANTLGKSRIDSPRSPLRSTLASRYEILARRDKAVRAVVRARRWLRIRISQEGDGQEGSKKDCCGSIAARKSKHRGYSTTSGF
jgi:hypothetical protein